MIHVIILISSNKNNNKCIKFKTNYQKGKYFPVPLIKK